MLLFLLFLYWWWFWISLLNMVKVQKLVVNICKNAPSKSKARASTCYFVLLSLLPPHDDIRLFMNTQWMVVCFVVFVTKVVPLVVHIVHLNISDQIQPQACTDVCEKFPFWEKNKKKKWNPTTIVCLCSLPSRWPIRTQAAHRRGALKRQELNRTEGLHKGPEKDK